MNASKRELKLRHILLIGNFIYIASYSSPRQEVLSWCVSIDEQEFYCSESYCFQSLIINSRELENLVICQRKKKTLIDLSLIDTQIEIFF